MHDSARPSRRSRQGRWPVSLSLITDPVVGCAYCSRSADVVLSRHGVGWVTACAVDLEQAIYDSLAAVPAPALARAA